MPRPKGDSPVKWSATHGQYVLYHNRKLVRLGTNKVAAERQRLALLETGETKCPPIIVSGGSLSVGEAAAAYHAFAAGHYRDSRTINRILIAIEALTPFADLPAADFKGRTLRQYRETLLGRRKSNGEPLSRRYINHLVQAIQMMFGWLVSEDYVPADVLLSLRTVKALEKGKGGREKPPVPPVPDSVIEATLPFCGPTVSALIQLQRLTGCRPGEAIGCKGAEIKQTPGVWWWTPDEHKNAHRGKARVIPIGPRGQALLRPFLAHAREYLFSPADDCDSKPANPMIRPGECYTIAAYENAIKRAVRRARRAQVERGDLLLSSAFVPLWCPGQIRHTTATDIRRQFGREAAAEFLGHSGLAVIDVYAEPSAQTAAEIASKVG